MRIAIDKKCRISLYCNFLAYHFEFLTKNLYFGDKKTLCSRVDGDRKQTGLDNVSAGRWLCLAPYDSQVYRIVADLYDANGYYRGSYGNLTLGIANLVRWRAWFEHR